MSTKDATAFVRDISLDEYGRFKIDNIENLGAVTGGLMKWNNGCENYSDCRGTANKGCINDNVCLYEY